MEYKPKMYAKALVDLMLDKKNLLEQKKTIDTFLKILEKNGDLKKASEIVSLTEKLFLKKTGIRKITIETARKITSKNMLHDFTVKNDIVEEKINSELIAGIKIIINSEKQLDFSLKRKLESIF